MNKIEKDIELTLTPKEIESAFAYAVSFLSPNGVFVVNNPLNKLWYRIIHNIPFKEMSKEERFTIGQLQNMLSKEVFESIPEIRVLNEYDDIAIDLGELSDKTIEIIVKTKMIHIEHD